MSFLKRTIRNAVSQGISRGLSDAVSKAVKQTVEPKATEYANRAADHFDQTAGNVGRQARQTTSSLEGAFANLERSVQNYANQMTKDLKVCPECGQPTTADKKFCPGCGAKLPEQTLGQNAICPACGKQNSVGTKFCQDCGTKLPAALQKEEMAARKNAAVMAQWDEMLPQYPRWTCGGAELYIEDYGSDGVTFSVSFNGNTGEAHRAVEAYRQILQQNGFRPAGQYPSVAQLFKRIDGEVFNVDTEHCFEGDPDCACIGFCRREPYGGFDYVKPEPKKSRDIGLDELKDLTKLFRR